MEPLTKVWRAEEEQFWELGLSSSRLEKMNTEPREAVKAMDSHLIS